MMRKRFSRHSVESILVGSMGMAAQGIVRATREVDFFVSPEPENVEGLRRTLSTLFDDPSIAEITAEDLGGDYPAVQYTPPGGDYWIDLMSRLGEAFEYATLRRTSGVRSI